ncbi:MAG TPA: NADH-quinone oxidoreductase subunit I [Planctomycetota bacterium]|nr:NADH-quinone oxidoreductase subunit I [Planctomycetota bacterium]
MVPDAPPLPLADRFYLPAILRGLRLTFGLLFRRKFTRRYPEEPLPKTLATKGQPRLVQNEDETVRCVSCGLCEYVCPAFAIRIEGQETDRPVQREPKAFEIDMLKCILCGYCEEVCPEEAIYMSDELELADFSRAAHVYTLPRLLRPAAVAQPRLLYARKLYDRWRKPSSTPSA